VEKPAQLALQENIALMGNSPGLGPTGTFTLGTSVLGGQATIKERITFKQLTGTMLDLSFIETSANPVTLYDFEIYAIPRGLRNS
jgi:hypothetical protein